MSNQKEVRYLYKIPIYTCSLIPIGKVQVSKKLIIWLSIVFINGNVCDTVATMTSQSINTTRKLNRGGSIAIFTFWKTLVSKWNNFKQGYSGSRIASGGHFFFLIKWGWGIFFPVVLPYLYTCLTVSLYYIQLIHQFVIEKGSTIDTIHTFLFNSSSSSPSVWLAISWIGSWLTRIKNTKAIYYHTSSTKYAKWMGFCLMCFLDTFPCIYQGRDLGRFKRRLVIGIKAYTKHSMMRLQHVNREKLNWCILKNVWTQYFAWNSKLLDTIMCWDTGVPGHSNMLDSLSIGHLPCLQARSNLIEKHMQ